MKKFLIAAFVGLGLFASAQSTPRFGTTSSTDNTGRVLTYAYTTTVDVAQATIDTMYFQPTAHETIWKATLSDSCVVKLSSTTTSYRVGDIFTVMLAKGTGAGRIRLGGSKAKGSTTTSTGIALAANKRMIVRYMWDGSYWVEISRVVEP